MTPLHVTSHSPFLLFEYIIYLTLPNIVPFWLCFNIRSTMVTIVYRPIFFLHIPIPCYIFIKQMSLLLLFCNLRIISCFTWMSVGQITVSFNLFYVANAIVFPRVFHGHWSMWWQGQSWPIITQKNLLTLSLFVH